MWKQTAMSPGWRRTCLKGEETDQRQFLQLDKGTTAATIAF
jgi:hypothetical protein